MAWSKYWIDKGFVALEVRYQMIKVDKQNGST